MVVFDTFSRPPKADSAAFEKRDSRALSAAPRAAFWARERHPSGALQSVDLQRQHFAGRTDHQAPGIVRDDLDRIAPGRTARELYRVRVFARRQFEHLPVRRLR